MMAARAVSLQEFDKLLHLIYLANEILFKAMQQQQGIAKQEEGQTHLDPAAAAAVNASFLPAASVIMSAAFAAAQVSCCTVRYSGCVHCIELLRGCLNFHRA
jgi:hypothetical protein